MTRFPMSRAVSATTLLLILLPALGTAIEAVEQAPSQSGIEVGAAFLMAFPKDEMAEFVDNTGYGALLSAGWTPGDKPFMLGVEFGFLNYGNETREEPFSLTIPDVYVDVTTSNNLLISHAFLRLGPPRGRIRPYVEGLVGFKHFSTETTIKDQDSTDDEDVIASSTNLSDTAFSWGGGAGAHVLVYESEPDVMVNELGDEIPTSTDPNGQIYLFASARYLFGKEARYLKPGSIVVEEGQASYTVLESKTDMMFIQIGVNILFDM